MKPGTKVVINSTHPNETLHGVVAIVTADTLVTGNQFIMAKIPELPGDRGSIPYAYFLKSELNPVTT